MITPRPVPIPDNRPVVLAPERAQAYLRAVTAMPLPADPRAGFSGRKVHREMPILELDQRGETPSRAVCWDHIDSALDILRVRGDCQDFAMSGLVRLLYRHDGSSQLDRSQWTAITDALIAAKYWNDEPNDDSACFTSENHQVLYHSAEYLVGQHFPETVFGNNGKLGCWHREHGREMLERWLDWRTRLGFSEWNSTCYADEDIAPLLNVIDFADDSQLRHRARVVLDQLVIQLALIAFRSVPGGSQGRAYAAEHLNPKGTPMAAFGRLLFSDCPATDIGFSIGAIALCASDYQPPAIAVAIAADAATRESVEIRERHGCDVEDAVNYGIRPDRVSDLDFFTASGEGNHHLVVEANYAQNSGKGHWYGREYYKTCKRMGEAFDPDPHQHALTQADLYHYRTPHYMLSAAQDYRAGKPGYQQFIWCARLSDAVQIFSNNPAPADVPYGRPGPWCGNGILPRVLAHRNVAIALHEVEPYPIYDQPPWYKEDYVHIYFPQSRFEEWREENGWLFGRVGDSYVAITASEPGEWIAGAADAAPHEYRIMATHVAVVCELGDVTRWGSFADFVAAIAAVRPEGGTRNLRYDSPSLGSVRAGWKESFSVAGRPVSVRDYPRFDCPWAQVPFGQSVMTFTCGPHRLHLDPDDPSAE